MKNILPAAVLLSMSLHPAVAADHPIEIRRFQCFTKNAEPLGEPAGGPGGSHWNPEHVRCEIELRVATSEAGARIDLRYGQPPAKGSAKGSAKGKKVKKGTELELVARRFVAAPDPLDPFATAPEEARTMIQRLFVPSRVIEAALHRTERDAGSGAAVFPLRFELAVASLDGERVERRVLDWRCATGE